MPTMDTEERVRESHRNKVVRLIGQAQQLPARGARSDVLKEAAESLFEIRCTFLNEKTGLPDWAGRSYAYRQYLQELYLEAGLPEGNSTIKFGLRHHTANVIRKRLNEDELADAGLSKESRNFRTHATYTRQVDLAGRAGTLIRQLGMNPNWQGAEGDIETASEVVKMFERFLKNNR